MIEHIEECRLSIRIKLTDGQEISVWVWKEKDRKRARKYVKRIQEMLTLGCNSTVE